MNTEGETPRCQLILISDPIGTIAHPQTTNVGRLQR